MFAQIGLADPTGGIVVLLFVGVLAVAGLVMLSAGAVLLVRRRASRGKAFATLALGLLLASPALWFAYELFAPDIPRDKAWDLSSNRSVSQLREEGVREEYSYSGHIRSAIKLTANRQWSGDAQLVLFRISAGKIAEIHWKSRPVNARRTYADAARILKGLALPDRDLVAWYTDVQRGEQASFSAVDGSDPDASIEVLVLGTAAEDTWVIHVNVWLMDGKHRRVDGQSAGEVHIARQFHVRTGPGAAGARILESRDLSKGGEDMSEKNLNETHKEAFEVARRAGLEKAVMEFPEDVLVAAEAAARARSAFPAPVSPNAEPWPPMKVSE